LFLKANPFPVRIGNVCLHLSPPSFKNVQQHLQI
jgi:hypothetical protein